MLLTAGAGPARGAAPALDCKLQLLPPRTGGSARPLRVVLVNRGPVAVHVLEWATPFEGWLAPFVRLRHNGQDLPYHGAMAKRGDPGLEEYLLIEPGRQRQATVDLADVFTLSRPGRYDVEPVLQLQDVVMAPARPPRKRGALQPLLLDCRGLAFTVAAG